MRTIEVLELAGSPHDIGLQHGSRLGDDIAACLGIYRDIFRRSDAEVLQAGTHFERVVRRYAPRLAEEIDAIAKGSEQPRFWLYALNARSELVPFATPECTAAFLPQARVLCQTWDWLESLEPLVTVLRIEREDGHQIATVTEPGIVGKIGVSSAGIGVCLNFMAAPGRLDGVPIHIVQREVLEATDLAQVRRRLQQAGVNKGGNVLVGSASGMGVSAEFFGTHMQQIDIEDDPFVHTNHCFVIEASASDGIVENSKARLNTARRFLDAEVAGIDGPDDGAALLQSLLSDQSHSQHPICRPYAERDGRVVGTVCSVLMDLQRRSLDVRMGPHPNGRFEPRAVLRNG